MHKSLISLVLVPAMLAGTFWAAAVLAQSRGGEANKKVRAKPPSWDQRLLREFFADARDALEGEPPVPGSTVRPGGGAVPPGGDPGTVAGGGDTYPWSKLIKREVIEDEIKTVVAPLSQTVQVPGKFKTRDNQDARQMFSMMAVLFGVIAQYDADVRWKEEAPGIREAMAHAADVCKVGTDNSYKTAKETATGLEDLVRGGKMQTPEPNPDVTWDLVVEVPPMMKRMETAGQDHLKKWTASKSEFDANKDDIAHEAQILAVLSRLVKHEDYGYGGDGVFDGYADQITNACGEIVQAVEADNYETASSAVGDIMKACSSCHQDYR